MDQIQEPDKEKPETKQSIRSNVWQDIVSKKLWAFPIPFGHIPNFKGTEEATQKLTELPEYQSAKVVEVNPDKPLEICRKQVLEDNKELYVTAPGLRSGLLKKFDKNETTDVKKLVSFAGIKKLGKNVGFEENVVFDLLVVGSVAVSKDGYRIGKGKGFVDLEYGMMKELNYINDKTVIVTLVHDVQVFDKLPENLFKNHDVPVDYIVTNTQIIKTETKIPKPEGIYWNLLTETRLNSINILQTLKKKYEEEGKQVVINSKSKRKGKLFRRPRKPYKSVEKKSVDTQKETEQTKSNNEELDTPNKANKENIENVPPNNPRQFKRGRKLKKYKPGYSLRVSNIQRDVRVRELKNALAEKGIKPNSISWKGFNGYCFLHYSSKSNNKLEDENENKAVAFSIDNVIELIQQININPDPEQNLDVKVMEPITRIETLDVTSV